MRLLGVLAFVTIATALENEIGLPADMTFRIALAAACLLFIHYIGTDYPGEQWPRTSLWIALLFNFSLFFTPLLDGPASKGDVLLFALPNAIIVFAARTVSYSVVDDRTRAVRQQLILGLILAVAISAILLMLVIIPPPAER